MSKQRTNDSYPDGVTTVAREMRAYEEYLAGVTDKQTYLDTDSRDLVRDIREPGQDSHGKRE
ncbi:hypothetical protein [Haliangium sp. UPWRP_2]|uniref:hypothetical protein n=1 Tax=Haliangium sp. UPWRP_2 TaxID=1931276 RepID=UPI0011B226DC|nr:hypothetical protein [Haliangium sp. UPWRP_2]